MFNLHFVCNFHVYKEYNVDIKDFKKDLND